MHGSLEVTDLIRLYVSDSIEDMTSGPLAAGNNITLAIMGDDETVIRGAFETLSDGGEVQIPLGPQPWGDVYGAFTDKFGINWKMNISAAS